MKIIVAGSGIGGLISAGMLASKGFDVALYARGNADELGYDWTDSLDVALFGSIIGKEIPKEDFCYDDIVAFYPPSQRMAVSNAAAGARTTTKMERRVFERYAAQFVADSGVDVHWNTVITAPICQGDKVVGIETDKGSVYGDLVIDACGLDSPIRRNLPQEMMIENDYGYGEAFYVYRVMYERKVLGEKPECPLEIYLKHLGGQGISWYCTRDDEIDILIGRFEKVREEVIKTTLDAFEANHKELMREVKRGSDATYKIPVRRPLHKMVADGYAAIGDSAYMTLPMNGSGINFSMKAAKLLVDAISSSEGEFTTSKLWNYQYEYYKRYGANLVSVQIIKDTLLGMRPKRVDALFENRVITQKEMDSEEGLELSFGELLGKAVRGMRSPGALIELVKGLAKGGKLSKHFANLPEVYSAAEFAAWDKKAKELL